MCRWELKEVVIIDEHEILETQCGHKYYNIIHLKNLPFMYCPYCGKVITFPWKETVHREK